MVDNDSFYEVLMLIYGEHLNIHTYLDQADVPS